MKSRCLLARAGALALTASLWAVAPAGATTLAGCAGAPAGGGEWRAYGHDLSGDRNQPQETTLGPAQAAGLVPAWTFKVGDASADGSFSTTPTIADGCAFIGTSSGWIFALNADTGKLVWKAKLPVGAPGLLGTGAVGAPTVQGGRVYVVISQAGDGKTGPTASALDEATGRQVWGPVVLDTRHGAYSDASPVLYHGLLLAGFNGDETYSDSRGGYDILNATTGAVLRHVYTIPDAEFSAGAGGGSIWSTPVVDRQGYAYAGTSNPVGDKASNLADSIVKIDLSRRRATFGEIVAHYHGNDDAAVPEGDNPLCGKVPHSILGQPYPTGDGALSPVAVGCLRMDSDFGASPNLFMIGGRPAVGELQKSGHFHAAFTAGMTKAWETVLGPWFFYGNLADSATDGTSIYAAAEPGTLFALNARTGTPRWVLPLGDLVHFQSVSVADGVVYVSDALGYLWIVDAHTGRVIQRRQFSADNGGDTSDQANQLSVGVSIARHGVFAAGGDFLVRYSSPVGGGGGAGGPLPVPLPPLPGVPGSPAGALGAPVLAGPGAASVGYATPEAVVTHGGTLTFVNGDTAQHNVQSTQRSSDGRPLFASALVGAGQTATVNGVDKLAPGSYQFVCQIHGGMKGTLVVLAGGS